MQYTYDHPRPSLAVDNIIFGLDGSDLKVLLIERGREPFIGSWALPGGFVAMDEGLEDAARRELEEETDVRDIFMEQLFTFGDLGRDPRGRVISVAYFALVNLKDHPVKGGSDAKHAEWFPVNKLPTLAFDHANIMKLALERLRAKVRYQPVGFELLPEKFTLTQLQDLYEQILGKPLNKRNFRTKIVRMGFLKENELQKDVAHRPAMLYSFDKAQYKALSDSGWSFEI